MNTQAKITVAISSHVIDCLFAQHLINDLARRNFNIRIKSLSQLFDDNVTCLIAIIRPEYLANPRCTKDIETANKIGCPVISVLRHPIDISDWPLHITLHSILDFIEVVAKPEEYHSQLATLDDLIHTISRSSIIRPIQTPIKLLSNEHGNPKNSWVANKRFILTNPINSTYQNSSLTEPESQVYIGIEAVREIHESFILVGGAGTGKTSIMKSIAQAILTAYSRDPNSSPLPFFLSASTWHKSMTIPEWMEVYWPFESSPLPSISSGGIYVLIDGVTEVYENSLAFTEILINWLNSNAAARVILSCRETGMFAFNDMELPIVRIQSPRSQDLVVLKTALQSHHIELTSQLLYYFSKHPDLLSLLEESNCLDCLHPNELLPSIMIETLVYKMMSDITPHQPKLSKGLSSLACFIAQNENVYVPYAQALDILGDVTSFQQAIDAKLITIANCQVRFTHYLFEAYFTALGIEFNTILAQIPPPSFVGNVRQETFWDEIVKLYSQLYQDPDHFLHRVSKINPFLAIDCVIAGARVNHFTYAQLLNAIATAMIVYGDKRVDLARQLSFIDSSSAKSLTMEIIRDTNWLANTEVVKLINEVASSPLGGLVEALSSPCDGNGSEVAYVLKMLADEAFFTLYYLHSDAKANTRKRVAWALGELNEHATIPILRKMTTDIDIGVANQAHASIAKIENNILAKAQIVDIDCSFEEQLGSNKVDNQSDHSLRTRIPKRRNMFNRISHTLYSLRKPKRKDSSDIVKSRLLEALGKTVTDQSHSIQKRNLPVDILNNNDSNEYLRDSQFEINRQILRLRNGQWNERESASRSIREQAKSLKGTNNSTMLVELLSLLSDNDWLVRWTAIEAFAWLEPKNNTILGRIKSTLRDPNWKVRVATIHALIKIIGHDAIAPLSSMVSDRNPIVREAALEAMGTMASKDTISILAHAITDDEEFVRLAAVTALDNINHIVTVDPLLLALHDPSTHVRWAAANALIDVATVDTIPYLKKSLEDRNGPYWEQKRICDVIKEILDKLDTGNIHHNIV
ncbi:MAG: HEAT repeat domain-containing protein [Anaerolineae bacterium]